MKFLKPALLGFSLVVLGCTPHRPYRALAKEPKSNENYVKSVGERPVKVVPDLEKIDPHSELAKDCLEKYTDRGFWLGHVEYTDYGSFWDPRQISTIERALSLKGEGGPGNLFANGATIIVYVHGWQNNSKEGNSNLREFRKLLADEAAKEKCRPADAKRGVLGLYLGWRGESTPILGIKHLTTYWARKRVAHRVGQGSMVETLARIKNLHKGMAARSRKDNQTIYKNNRLVLIGHSFGAAALYSAVGPHLESKFLEPYWDARRNAKRSGSDTQMERVTGYGDLVVLINPAFEALPYRSLHYAVHSNQNVNYDPKQSVLMVVLSGQGDAANKTYLPIGQLLGNRQQVFTMDPALQSEQRQMLTSLGHNEKYQTHELKVAAEGSPVLKLEPMTTFSEVAPFDEDGDRIVPGPVKGLRLKFKSGPAGQPDAPARVDVATGTPFYPLMVISTDSGIIKSHNGFWPTGSNRRCYDFLSWLISAQNREVVDAREEDAVKFDREVSAMQEQVNKAN